MHKIEDINTLDQLPSGVMRHAASAKDDFSYSDGSETEQYLAKVFELASDLSSTSEELQAKIKDWPTEYHLSPVRANILRGLDLSGVTRALELGCGCGAITRYLSEQTAEVDAIEGSAIRAQLARQRNRDCTNVNIIHANFNYIDLPDRSYDAIFLIGVAEYARKFFPDAATDHEAVVILMNKLRPALSSQGAIYIAIENRVGLKYLLGAHEDHYSLRYVGLDLYRETAGIRTYDFNEWQTILSSSNLNYSTTLSVYPDYKIPTVVLGEQYIRDNPYAHNHLEGIGFTDYTIRFKSSEKTQLILQAMNNSKQLGNFANSFLIVAGESDVTVKAVSKIDFIHLPRFNRKREYCLRSRKYHHQDEVKRNRISGVYSKPRRYSHFVRNEKYHRGQLLSAIWARYLIIYPQPDRFERCLRKYFSFINNYKKSYNKELTVDLLPSNIVVDDDGSYRVFDQEWESDNPIDSGFVYFRALINFRMTYQQYLKSLPAFHQFYLVVDFIRYGFDVIGRDLDNLDQYCQLEDEFQEMVALNPSTLITREILNQPLSEFEDDNEFYPRCYWKTVDESYSEENSVNVKAFTSPEYQDIKIRIPQTEGAIRVLRFDPCDCIRPHDSGYLTIQSLELILIKIDGERMLVLKIENGEQATQQAQISGLQLLDDYDCRILVVTSDDPYLEFEILKHQSWRMGDSYEFNITLSFTRSREYRMARQKYLDHNQSLVLTIEKQETELSLLRKSKKELEGIKSSVSWRIIKRLVSWIPYRN